jgi:hypothetical protein
MCPDDPTAKANIHPTVQGYKYIGGVFFETLLGLGD